ncbi:MAG: metal ABC transporter solute-binding protein, Zn/Mn family [Spirochaetota bacterium]
MKKSILIAIMLVLAVSCAKREEKDSSIVFVSILPQRYFVQRIVGDMYDVEVMVRPGHSPATYEVLPAQMARLSDARIYFRIGVPFEESWMDRIAEANPNMTIVDTREGVKLRKFNTFKDEPGHGHEDDHDSHDHAGTDPHIWLSPSAVKIQARTIFEEMARLAPEHAEYYSQNLDSFLNDLDKVHSRIESSLAELKNREIMVFHPAFGYFTDEFGLKQIPIEVAGKEPGPGTVRKMIDLAQKHDIRVIFVQKQFSTASAEAVAEGIGGTVVQIDPLAEAYLDNLENIAHSIRENVR